MSYRDQVFVKPSREGLIVRDPVSMTPLSESGEWKPLTGKRGNYWRRRIKDGSTVESRQEIAKAKPVKSEITEPKLSETLKRQTKDERRS